MDPSPTDTLRAVQQAWTDAFAVRDADRLAALYTVDAAFYGSTAILHRGRDGVRAYFAGLPADFVAARFLTEAVQALAPGVVAATGPVVFTVARNGGQAALRYRMTQVMVREGGAWRIAAHHASPMPG